MRSASQLESLVISVARATPVFSFGALPVWLFERLTSLTCLCFDNCGVTSIPESVSSLAQLADLSILSVHKPEDGLVVDISAQVGCVCVSGPATQADHSSGHIPGNMRQAICVLFLPECPPT